MSLLKNPLTEWAIYEIAAAIASSLGISIVVVDRVLHGEDTGNAGGIGDVRNRLARSIWNAYDHNADRFGLPHYKDWHGGRTIEEVYPGDDSKDEKKGGVLPKFGINPDPDAKEDFEIPRVEVKRPDYDKGKGPDDGGGFRFDDPLPSTGMRQRRRGGVDGDAETGGGDEGGSGGEDAPPDSDAGEGHPVIPPRPPGWSLERWLLFLQFIGISAAVIDAIREKERGGPDAPPGTKPPGTKPPTKPPTTGPPGGDTPVTPPGEGDGGNPPPPPPTDMKPPHDEMTTHPIKEESVTEHSWPSIDPVSTIHHGMPYHLNQVTDTLMSFPPLLGDVDSNHWAAGYAFHPGRRYPGRSRRHRPLEWN